MSNFSWPLAVPQMKNRTLEEAKGYADGQNAEEREENPPTEVAFHKIKLGL